MSQVAVVLAFPVLLLGLGVLAGSSAVSAGRLWRSLSLTSWATDSTNRFRLLIGLEASRCMLVEREVYCTLIIRTRNRYEIVFDDVSVELLRPTTAPEKSLPVELPAGIVDVRPRIGKGETIVLAAATPTPVGLRFTAGALCTVPAGTASEPQAEKDWALRVTFSGHAMGNGSSGFDEYRLGDVSLDRELIARSRMDC